MKPTAHRRPTDWAAYLTIAVMLAVMAAFLYILASLAFNGWGGAPAYDPAPVAPYTGPLAVPGPMPLVAAPVGRTWAT